MTQSSHDLADRLQAAGVPVGPVQPVEPESPWFVKTLLALSGWLASLFILGFLGLALESVVREAGGASVVGVICLVCAYGLFRLAGNDFVEHLGLAVSLAGQLLIAWALSDQLNFDLNSLFWAALCAIQLFLAIAMPNFIHRVVTMGFACLAFGVAMYMSGWLASPAGVPLLALVVLWLNEFRVPRWARAFQALGYGLALGVVIIGLFLRFGWADEIWPSQIPQWTTWVDNGIALLALVLLLVAIFQRVDWQVDSKVITLAFFASIGIGLLSLEIVGLVPAVVLLVLGFAVSNRLLMGLGIAASLLAVSSYYYWLEVTLLIKAATLFGLGAVLLLVRWALVRWLGREVNDA
ncbi:DUF4401 domain-containing protein [Saccharospirillum salsuginis]|uniref:DUF4401 domain-containing protein n=1 Tax=Saccharospirillum salsuginis TaxID=418750 RepID=A0A918N7L2_9GAMM|nr:DUF4401 domain-containing protein [Saccharospirillum salsuginis]GGX43840.1 hypothetical protein GCM10007392_08240 [Saccharospirillum salsuginis]